MIRSDLVRALAPTVAVEIYGARTHLARLTGRGAWRLACRREVRESALRHFNFVLLPNDVLRHPTTVVDVGANVGDWSASLLSLARPRSLVLFEPDPRLTSGLSERFKNFTEVSVVAKAVGAESSEISFNQTSAAWGSSALTPLDWAVTDYGPQHLTVESRTTVPQTTLDAALRDYASVDLIKIDVQGMEQQVLAGAADVLSRTDVVLLETNWCHHYEGDALFCTLHDHMTRAGFHLTNISLPNHAPDGRALWSDAVYVSAARLDAARATSSRSRR